MGNNGEATKTVHAINASTNSVVASGNEITDDPSGREKNRKCDAADE